MSNSLVLITNSTNQGFGTGFVVRKERNYSYIVTCSHVVEDTPKTLLVDGVKAKIVYQGSSDGLDLAILKASIDREPLGLMESDCNDFEIKGFRSFKNSDHILEPIECKVDTKIEFRPKEGGVVHGWKLNIDESDSVERGYSGSPLICKESGRVVGVMSNRKGGREGFAISIGHLRDIWEGMPSNLLMDTPSLTKPNRETSSKKRAFSIKKYLLESVIGVIILGLLTNYLYDKLKLTDNNKSEKAVKIIDNNSTNSTIELHNEKSDSTHKKEIEFKKNQTQNSTIKVFQ